MVNDPELSHCRVLLALSRAMQITAAIEIVAKKLIVPAAEPSSTALPGAARQATLLRRKDDKSRDAMRLEEELPMLCLLSKERRLKKQTKRGGESGELAVHFDSLDAPGGTLFSAKSMERVASYGLRHLMERVQHFFPHATCTRRATGPQVRVVCPKGAAVVYLGKRMLVTKDD